MSPLGLLHTSAAVAALALGAAVLLVRPRGARRHRQLGWAYALSMLLLNITALQIYRLFGGFGPFHVAALVSLATLLAGLVSARIAIRARTAATAAPARRTHAIEHHYYWITNSYVGLVAAAVAETATRLPALRPAPGREMVFGAAVVIATVVVFMVGSRLIRLNAHEELAPFRRVDKQ